jgi:type IV pilus assembly protein PilC
MDFNIENIPAPKGKKKEEKDVTDFLNKDIRLSPLLSAKYLEKLYSKMAVLLDSGLDVHSSLKLIEAQNENNKYFKKVIHTIHTNMIKGLSFSESLKETKAFSDFDYYSIKIGEDSGQLYEVFNDLKIFYNQKIENRRLVVSSLTYPVIVLVFTSLVVTFLMLFLVPMFQEMFNRSGNSLPGITQWVIAVSTFLQKNGWVILVSLLLMIISGFFLTKRPKVKRQLDYMLIKTPLLKTYLNKVNTLRFVQLLLLMNKAHLPITQSLELIEKGTFFFPIKDLCARVQEHLLNGQSFSKSLEDEKFLGTEIITLIKIGEQGNKLGSIYQKLSDQLKKEIEYQNKLLTSLIEPFILLFLGSIVAIVLISMYLPLFQLNSGMGF